MSRTVEVVKACQPHFTQTRYNYKTPDLFWRDYSLSGIFTDLILHNYRSNQSALMTRFGTDLRHQYGIFGGESQTSFTQNATWAGSEEGRLFSQASRYTEKIQIMTHRICHDIYHLEALHLVLTRLTRVCSNLSYFKSQKCHKFEIMLSHTQSLDTTISLYLSSSQINSIVQSRQARVSFNTSW